MGVGVPPRTERADIKDRLYGRGFQPLPFVLPLTRQAGHLGSIGLRIGISSMTTIDRTRHGRVAGVRPMPSPRALRSELPLTTDLGDVVIRGRDATTAILTRRDDRLLVVVGPCSIHDPIAAYEYARRLAELSIRLGGQLHVVMRAYFEKPRTTLGWKGLINDPGLDESFRLEDGLVLARSLLLEILSLGVPVGCEFLDPISPRYLEDTVSWGAIGARTSQSQIHRQVASGLSMPIGFKNSTEGDVQGAVDAVTVATSAHVFAGVTEDGATGVMTTIGNPDCHVVLRGGRTGPNYDEASVAKTLDLLERAGQSRRVVVDASHDNSDKDHRRQPLVVAEIARRIRNGEREIVGVMLESFPVAGRQDLEFGRSDDLSYGQSITDACIGWQETVAALEHLADAVRIRNAGK
jgi:3-deoxy-7-phosphoheptulonate synthase